MLGAAQAVHFRNSMNVDGIAYLDMGDAYLQGDWATAVRSHWSPLYGWLLGAALRVVQPSPGFEFPLVHVVNLLIYICALAAFTFLMYAARVREPLLVSIGYAVFVFSTLQYTPLGLVTPDLLVSAIMYVVCAVLLLTRERPSRGSSAVLGLLLGLGYLAKAPMLPLAIVILLASALLVAPAWRLAHVGTATLIMAMLVVPFVLALSIANGGLTIGDSARLNYLWRINGLPLVHWQGGPEGLGQPLHRSTLLLERPPVYAFESPYPVTYSPWYAPEYWFRGATPVLDLRGQLQAMLDGLEVYRGLAVDLSVPLVGVATLLAVSCSKRSFAVGPWLGLLAPAGAALAMYTFVLVESRYVAPFLVLLILGLLTLVQLPRTCWTAGLALAVSLVLLVQIAATNSGVVRTTLAQAVRGQIVAADDQVQVARALRSAGVQAGDRLATGNRGFNAYWARLTRVTIAAEVSGYDATQILDADPDARKATQDLLLAQDVRAVVAYSWPAYTGDPGWTPVEGTDYFYYLRPA